ncbi:MAG: type II toxin-antitoxin system VapC family toxin [bacterium]|nr:type II toxin-antitoxin system VapC family toxin [bacterium]
MSEEDYEAALWLFLSDVRNEEYIITPLSDKVMEAGVDLTRRHPLRGYDAIQLATAIILRNALIRTEELSLFIFVSADNALCEAARSEGLPADNPDEH